MNLPVGNNTAVLQTQYRYVLQGNPETGEDGIYIHRDDSACYFIKINLRDCILKMKNMCLNIR